MKIKSKTYINHAEPVKVYDLTINEKTPCFSLDAGIFSHNTRRWRSGAHIIPPNAEIRDIQLSRFTNGLVGHFDCSQMELRVLAAMAKDESMLQAFKDNRDIHRFIASKVWRIPESQVTDEQRKVSKSSTFAILYGKTIKAFAYQYMQGDFAAAKEIFDLIYGTFKSLKKFSDECDDMLDNLGYVTTLWGDPIYIDFDREDRVSLAKAHREALNYRIQSTASNMVAVCLSRISQFIHKHNFGSRLFGFTHDAGDIDFNPSEFIPLTKILSGFSEKFPLKEWGIPLKIDFEFGTTGFSTVDLKRLKQRDYVEIENDHGILDCEFEGAEPVLLDIISRLKPYTQTIDFEIEERKLKTRSLGELFTMKGCYTSQIGQPIETCKGRIRISQKLKPQDLALLELRELS